MTTSNYTLGIGTNKIQIALNIGPIDNLVF
jgi:hypothetical protein